MTEIDILPWSELTAAVPRPVDRPSRVPGPNTPSPFFDLGFIDAVQAVRGDVDVAVADGSAPAAVPS